MCCSHWFWFSLLFLFLFSPTHLNPHTHSRPPHPSNNFSISVHSLWSLSLSRSLTLVHVCFFVPCRSLTVSFPLLRWTFSPFHSCLEMVLSPNCSGVSGALEGTSFQNHRPQRTHQTAYAKRKSRRRPVGHFIGEHIVDSQSRTLCIYLARAIHCILF